MKKLAIKVFITKHIYKSNVPFLGTYYLYLSDSHILELPSFTLANCDIDPYPVEGVHAAISNIVDNRLQVCGGGDANCYTLNGTSWEVQTSLSVPRYDAGGSRWMGGWLVTGGQDGSTRHSSSDLYTGGVWTVGPGLDTSTFWSTRLHSTSGHCQVTVGGRVIVAGEGCGRLTVVLVLYCIYRRCDWPSS